jgi:hypothetical protein
MSLLAPTLQAFFTDRLTGHKHASAHTIAAYRDTIRLPLAFAAQHTGKPPSDLDINDLGAPPIGAFLDHLEQERGNTIRTRNARLAAIRSLLRYAALRHPEHAATIQRVLAIQTKRHDQALVTSSPKPSSKHCSTPPTRRPGSAAATTPRSCSPPRPGRAPANCSAWPAATCASAPAPTSAARASAASSASRR